MALCDALCARVAACGVAWATSCPTECQDLYRCPGESPGQDEGMCSMVAQNVGAMSCRQLCASVTRSQELQAQCK
jgi:hypothetical protein